MDSFGRFGPFQWVTANPNKKIFSGPNSPLGLCAKCLRHALLSPSRQARHRASSVRSVEIFLTHLSAFANKILANSKRRSRPTARARVRARRPLVPRPGSKPTSLPRRLRRVAAPSGYRTSVVSQLPASGLAVRDRPLGSGLHFRYSEVVAVRGSNEIIFSVPNRTRRDSLC